MQTYLDFEKGLAELQGKAAELRAMARQDPGMKTGTEANQLDHKAGEMLRDLYKELTPWQKCQVARHPNRPHARDYIEALFTEFTPLAGDRNFAEDHAVMGGLARLNDRPVMVIGHEKGAEERGQAEAIARSTDMCLKLHAPLISVVIGEGGSGGAVAFATANRMIMLEHAIYSVISPEGCASILWKNADKTREAAAALRLTAQDLLELGVVDTIVPEPLGGAHRDSAAAIASVGEAIEAALTSFSGLSPVQIRGERRQKFIGMGAKGLG